MDVTASGGGQRLTADAAAALKSGGRPIAAWPWNRSMAAPENRSPVFGAMLCKNRPELVGAGREALSIDQRRMPSFSISVL